MTIGVVQGYIRALEGSTGVQGIFGAELGALGLAQAQPLLRWFRVQY